MRLTISLFVRCVKQMGIRSFSSGEHGPVTVYGQNGSPYTRKVEAALRYKQIPFIKKDLMPGNVGGDWDDLGLGKIVPKVIPVVKFNDGTLMNDSTKILQDLDNRYTDRPILPKDKGQRFLSLLLEDMFDEWGTKVMFGMRWLDKIDQDWSGTWLALDSMLGKGVKLDQVREFGKMFGSRQMSRMDLVGCKQKETVLRSLNYFADALDKHLEKGNMFILGQTPTVADFALYGQFSQLVVDITPDRLIRSEYPNVWAWIRKCEDMSGIDEACFEDEQCAQTFFKFAGDVYLPFLHANRQALNQGSDRVSIKIFEEIIHDQPVFKYQEKCFKTLQNEYKNLNEVSRANIENILAQTNCIQFFK